MFVLHDKFYVKITANDKSVKFKVRTYGFIDNDFQIIKIKRFFIVVNFLFFKICLPTIKKVIKYGCYTYIILCLYRVVNFT